MQISKSHIKLGSSEQLKALLHHSITPVLQHSIRQLPIKSHVKNAKNFLQSTSKAVVEGVSEE
jgi:hypothetical protein